MYFLKTADLHELPLHLQKFESRTKIYSIDNGSRGSTSPSLPVNLRDLPWNSPGMCRWTALNEILAMNTWERILSPSLVLLRP